MPGNLKHGSQPQTEFSNFAIVQIDLLVDTNAGPSEVFIIRNVTGLGQFRLTQWIETSTSARLVILAAPSYAGSFFFYHQPSYAHFIYQWQTL